MIFKGIYVDNISGKLSRDYEQEQEQLKAVMERLGREVKQSAGFLCGKTSMTRLSE